MRQIPVFRAKNLTKIYQKVHVLDEVNLTLEKGHIYGLVGNNGAGKTTLMRIIMGLCFPTSGSIELLGSSAKREIVKYRKRVGVIIESPIYYGNMSGRHNLELLRKLYGISDHSRVNQVLQQMDLSEKAELRVSKYSLGMRQRLAIAGALLGNPEFLILDEPLNGLDPSGIKEIRNLLLDFHQNNNKTILISSHYLEQLHMLATDYIFLHKGKIVEQLSQEQLSKQCEGYLLLECDNAQKAASLLKENFSEAEFEIINQKTVNIYSFHKPFQRIYGTMAIGQINVERLEQVGLSLEEYFNQIISRDSVSRGRP